MAGTIEDRNSSDIIVDAEKSAAMIMLISSDGEHFEVTEAVTGMSHTIAHMIEENCVESGVLLPNVKSAILAKVIGYCSKHVGGADSGNDTTHSGAAATGHQVAAYLKSFDTEFAKVDVPTLFRSYSPHVDVMGLLDLTIKMVADITKNMMPDDLCEMFNIIQDFRPEEEGEIRKENVMQIKPQDEA